VLVLRDGEVLLGRRRDSHGAGTWSPPGGHLEFGEEPEACAQRETLEESGITVADCEFVGITNDVFTAERRHYVTLFYRARAWSGVPRVCEPDKCDAWQWWPLDGLPENLFLPLRHLVETGLRRPA
jgi:8-oxo-dGTP diphosphatase